MGGHEGTPLRISHNSNLKKNMVKIYISGRISGLPIDEARRAFEAAEAMLRGLGLHAVNPMNIAPEEPGMTWEDYMAKDLPELIRCDAIYMLRNWGQSRGARIEYAVAREKDMLVFFQDENNHLRFHDILK